MVKAKIKLPKKSNNKIRQVLLRYFYDRNQMQLASGDASTQPNNNAMASG